MSHPGGLHERPLVWGRPGARSVGVLALPSSAVPASGIGVLLVVGGPQVRVGSHRQFVQTSRRLAAAGHAVLRFDFPGMGDSEGPTVGFEGASPAIAAALDVLQREVPGLRCTVLWGLCDGASAALLFLDEGGRGVDDLVLMNPWVRSAATQAATQVRHYYRERLLDPAFWRKLVRGGVARGAVGEALGTLRRMWRRPSTGDRPDRPGFVERMARAWTAHPGRILLLQSGRDYTAREFDAALATHPAWRAAARHPGLTRVDIAEADHTFSEQVQRRAAEDAMLVWLAAAADRVARDRRQS